MMSLPRVAEPRPLPPIQPQQRGCLRKLIDLVVRVVKWIYHYFFPRAEQPVMAPQVHPVEASELRRPIIPHQPALIAIPTPLRLPQSAELEACNERERQLLDEGKDKLDTAAQRGATPAEVTSIRDEYYDKIEACADVTKIVSACFVSNQDLLTSQKAAFDYITRYYWEWKSGAKATYFLDEILRNSSLEPVALTYFDEEMGMNFLHWAAMNLSDGIVDTLVARHPDLAARTTKPFDGKVLLDMGIRGSQSFRFKTTSGKTYEELMQEVRKTSVAWAFNNKTHRNPYLGVIFGGARKYPLIHKRMLGALEGINDSMDYDLGSATYLGRAINQGLSIAVVLALLDLGADPLTVARGGLSALDYAISKHTGHQLNPAVDDQGNAEMALALCLDAAQENDPNNFNTYEEIRDVQLRGNTFFHLLALHGDCDEGLKFELELASKLEDGYHPLSDFFDRMKDPMKSNNREKSVFGLLQYNRDNTFWNDFVAPLYARREQIPTVLQQFTPLPTALTDLIASYVYPQVDKAAEKEKLFKESTESKRD